MSAMNFIVHDASGRIIWTGSCDSEHVKNHPLRDGESIIDTGAIAVEQIGHFVSNGTYHARPDCPVVASVANRSVTLGNVPANAKITVTGAAELSETAQDSVVVLTFGAAGTYNVKVDCFPTLDYSGSFTLK